MDPIMIKYKHLPTSKPVQSITMDLILYLLTELRRCIDVLQDLCYAHFACWRSIQLNNIHHIKLEDFNTENILKVPFVRHYTMFQRYEHYADPDVNKEGLLRESDMENINRAKVSGIINQDIVPFFDQYFVNGKSKVIQITDDREYRGYIEKSCVLIVGITNNGDLAGYYGFAKR